jgi:GNAT superfamily N-acetyltransferase
MHSAFGEVVALPFGRGHFNAAISESHMANFVWAYDDVNGLGAAQLAAQADRVMGARGLRHRVILCEGAAADERSPWFAGRGWTIDHHGYLAHSLVPEGLDAGPAEEISIDEVVPSIERYLATDPGTLYARDPVVREHIVEQHRTYGRAGDAQERCFAVRVHGEPVAWAKLWTAGKVAQVEDVVCLADHRGKGYGRAVVAAATLAGLATKPDVQFIVADLADWPVHLYERLGYSQTGTIRVFTLMPAPAG